MAVHSEIAKKASGNVQNQALPLSGRTPNPLCGSRFSIKNWLSVLGCNIQRSIKEVKR
jgi:hypothetical protein